METIVSVKNLKKSYDKNRQVINDLSFDIKKGEILCFLGPNGAGKSTTINVLCGLLGYDDGEISYKGKNMKKCLNIFKRNLGVVPQDLALYEDISAEKNIEFFASLYGLRGKELQDSVTKALDFAGLLDRRKDKPSTFSGGMKRRLNIACAIAHNPELLIMDEPTVGIDPQSRNHILNSIKKLKNAGMTILYTTHYMEEVEEISTRIIIMDSGKIIAEGTKESLIEEVSNDKEFIIDIGSSNKINLDVLYEIEGIKKVELRDGKIVITTIKNVENLDKIIAELLKNKVSIINFSSKEASLESIFLKLTGKSLRD